MAVTEKEYGQQEICPVCKKDLSPTNVPSIAIEEWIPATQSNVLLQMYCPNHILSTPLGVANMEG